MHIFMTEATNVNRPETATETPLGRAYRLKQLPGLIAKYMDVPAGRQGVVIYAAGASRLLPPGRGQVLSTLGRLRGLGAGLSAGYVPAAPFTAWFKATNLFSGDNELIDAALLCQVQPVDAARFFKEAVLPRGELHAAGIDLDSESMFQTLGALVQRYAAQDLARNLPTERLLPELSACLQPALHAQGLRLAAIHFLSFRLAAQRAEIAEKALALEERLQDVAVQKKMLAIENQAQLDDFIQQLDPAFQPAARVRLGDAPAGAAPEVGAARSAVSSLLERFQALLKTESGSAGLPWRILQLWSKKQPDPLQPLARPARYQRWWLPRTLWIGFVLLVAYLLTNFVWNLADRSGWEDPWEVLSVIWAFAVGAVLESIKALYEKREEINELRFPEAGTTFLDDLTGNNRRRVDELVRDGCRRELAHSSEVLNELRGRIYRLGAEDLALSVRSLEHKFERAAAQIVDPNFGVAPYLGDLKISRHVWLNMLDFDEELLVRAAALAEDTRRIQQAYGQGRSEVDLLTAQEDRLDEFIHRFETRSRALRSSSQVLEAYRI